MHYSNFLTLSIFHYFHFFFFPHRMPLIPGSFVSLTAFSVTRYDEVPNVAKTPKQAQT